MLKSTHVGVFYIPRPFSCPCEPAPPLSSGSPWPPRRYPSWPKSTFTRVLRIARNAECEFGPRGLFVWGGGGYQTTSAPKLRTRGHLDGEKAARRIAVSVKRQARKEAQDGNAAVAAAAAAAAAGVRLSQRPRLTDPRTVEKAPTTQNQKRLVRRDYCINYFVQKITTRVSTDSSQRGGAASGQETALRSSRRSDSPKARPARPLTAPCR